jgi:transcriptional/translational regulatory protein YebC/TACO1
MSGHNKWSTIKRKKGALDAKRSKIFSRIIKEITVAVKEGGPDPDGNPRLRLAISNAKGASMPKDNILRAINKGSDKDAASYNETTYEGYAPNGVAIYIECTTDNLQRTISNIRSYFGAMIKKLEEMGIEPENAELQRLPKDTVKVDKEAAKKILRLIDLFEEDDDVNNVFHNLELTDELMEDLD